MTSVSGLRTVSGLTGEAFLTHGVNTGPSFSAPVQASPTKLPSLRAMLPWDEFEVALTLTGGDPEVVAVVWTLEIYPGTPIPESAPWLRAKSVAPYRTYAGTHLTPVLVQAADLPEGYSTLFLRTENYGESGALRSISYASWSVFRGFSSSPAMIIDDLSVAVPFMSVVDAVDTLVDASLPAFSIDAESLADLATPAILFPPRRV